MNTPSKSERLRADDDDQISIEHAMSDNNTDLFNYKDGVKNSMRNMRDILANIMNKYPETAEEIQSAQKICSELI
jgi:hypothetical protein